MKPLLSILAVSAALLMAFDGPVGQPGGLTVHEWGTFTSVAGEDGSALEWDTLGCKNDLPGFVRDYGYRGFKARLQGTVRMETPVIYFYSDRALDAHVKVSFPQGLITEWYPQADYAVYQKNRDGAMRLLEPNLNGIDMSMRNVAGAIEWNGIKVLPGTTPTLPVERGPSRYYAARETDAAPLVVGGQPEKFLFYRGVGRFPVPLSARVLGDGRVTVENRGEYPVASAILFENRGGRIGYRTSDVQDAATLDAPSLDGSFSELRAELQNALVAHGLFLKEAQAMVETWHDSWFEEGARLIYILPAPLVDAILPLQVEPAPSRLSRVFVGRIELLTSETQRAVETAVVKGDWPIVDRYSRFLTPILKRIASGDTIRGRQIETLFQKYQGPRECR